ncbi:hypothetical protein DPMN_099223 [Dreissena polymorpha]|uniref:Uncharacterized protein n=1 Tax=Dreissena polymorpha TaxID=45954 RepID=A0A9D4LGV4_DREPO|nr:hypothetical protein DPMN_099223 [Dreissena polymorpha]
MVDLEEKITFKNIKDEIKHGGNEKGGISKDLTSQEHSSTHPQTSLTDDDHRYTMSSTSNATIHTIVCNT